MRALPVSAALFFAIQAAATAASGAQASGDHGKKEVAAVHERSIGSPTDGHLIGGSRVVESPYVRIFPQYANDDVRYGLSELVSAIDRAAKEVHRHFPDAMLSVGHLSRRGGGEIDRHASHESGRDADVGFYVRNDAGKGVLADHMVQFRGDGSAASWPGAHFDDARNWTFVAALLADPHVHISYIFIAAPLRARLLSYAEKVGAPAAIREHAAMVVMQPRGALPHDDHFHIRISCPAGMNGCIEFPTRPKHARLVAPQRSRGAHGGSAVATAAGASHPGKPNGQSSPPPSASSNAAKPHTKPASLPVIDTEPDAPSIDLAVPSSDVPAPPVRATPDVDNSADAPIEDADGPLEDR